MAVVKIPGDDSLEELNGLLLCPIPYLAASIASRTILDVSGERLIDRRNDIDRLPMPRSHHDHDGRLTEALTTDLETTLIPLESLEAHHRLGTNLADSQSTLRLSKPA